MKKLLLSVITILTAANMFAQQNVGIGTTTPDASAVLDLAATDKGFLVPRVSQVERLAIVNPARGLMVYDIDADCFYFSQTFGCHCAKATDHCLAAFLPRL